jgi:hypothetical protein
VRYPRVQVAHVKAFTDGPYLTGPDLGLYLQITSRGVLNALKAIGCANTLLY